MVKPVEYKISWTTSNQIKTDSDIKEKLYWDGVGEYRSYCYVWDKYAKDRYYNNHLKSQILKNNFRRRQQLNNTNISTTNMY